MSNIKITHLPGSGNNRVMDGSHAIPDDYHENLIQSRHHSQHQPPATLHESRDGARVDQSIKERVLKTVHMHFVI